MQVPEFVRLRIHFNSTRRARWDAKLGFQRSCGPIPILLQTIHPRGGIVGHIRVYLARIYPLRFMEKEGESTSK